MSSVEAPAPEIAAKPRDATARSPSSVQDNTDRLAGVEARFLEFAQSHTVTAGGAAADQMRLGRFSAMPDQPKPDLFGAIDMAYAFHILGRLDEITDRDGRLAWAEFILSHQGEDGWFRSGDTQKHGVEHATAYALGALQILCRQDARAPLAAIRPFTGLAAQVAPHPGEDTAPFAVKLLDQIHFWRGSHRVGGLAAIVGAADELGLSSQDILLMPDAGAWLEGWWQYYARRISPATGYWTFGPRPARMAFNALYKSRHDPALAVMAGAVHLYWVSWRMGRPFPYPGATVKATAALQQPDGLYEKEPYCIDLDGNFMIARPMTALDEDDPLHAVGRKALLDNRNAVLEWFLARPASAWNPNSHKLPGAFAAVAEADAALGKARWNDVFQTTWWL